MSKTRRIIQYCVLLLAVLPSSILAKAKITFCAETRPYPPYIYIDERGEATGILIDIIKRSAKDSGFTPVFITHPWLRCQKLVADNEAQALFGMIRTPERELVYQFPTVQNQYIAAAQYPIFYAKKSVIDTHYNAVFLNAQFNSEAYRTYKKHGLQAPLGYVVQKVLTNYALTADSNHTVDEGLQMAARNRLDGYVVERSIGLARVTTLNLEDKLLVSDIAVTEDFWYVPFNKQFYAQNSKLVDSFWHRVAKNRE